MEMDKEEIAQLFIIMEDFPLMARSVSETMDFILTDIIAKSKLIQEVRKKNRVLSIIKVTDQAEILMYYKTMEV
jgi:hypothetical protein